VSDDGGGGKVAMCMSHLTVGPTDYVGHAIWMDARFRDGLRQRQCPKCLHWFYDDEMGPTKKARKP
jgi:hypothetical protein